MINSVCLWLRGLNMPLTNEVFFYVTGITLAILLALIIPMLVEIVKFRGDIKPICSLVNDVDGFFRQRGLEGFSKTGFTRTSVSKHHSLPPEKALERDNLTARGKSNGLTPIEADRLKQLLQEDANDELAKGVFGILAFIAIIIAIDALIKNLSKGR